MAAGESLHFEYKVGDLGNNSDSGFSSILEVRVQHLYYILAHPSSTSDN